MKSVDVLYLVEHVARELDLACAVAHLAARSYGLSVEIRSLPFGAQAGFGRIEPALVVVPYFGSRADFGIEAVLRAFPRARVVNLAFEQIFSPATARFKRPRDEAARRHVLHLAAGDFFRRFLVDAGVDESNVVTTGSLSCALYREPYRSYATVDREELARCHRLDATLPWVFLPENYGAAFFSDEAIEYRVRNGFDRRQVAAYRDHARAALAAVIPWCVEAARTGAMELIVRPRPATPRDSFVAAARRIAGELPDDHLHFVKDGSAREWVLASDVVVSSISTTLLEASLVPKPVYHLVPHPVPDFLRADWFSEVPEIRTREEFLEALERPATSTRLGRWARRELLPAGDPILNVVDVLADLLRGKRAAPAPPPFDVTCPPEAEAATPRAPSRRFRAGLRRLLGRGSEGFPLHSLEDDRFSRADVRRRSARWARILD